MQFISRKIKVLASLIFLASFSCKAQPAPDLRKATDEHTLLWEISGKDLTAPSYFFGTMHMLCPEDAKVSPALNTVLDQVKQIYFEVDMDDMMAILGSLKSMRMLNETKLSDLLSPQEYERVSAYFKEHSPLPFAMIENFKPMLLGGMVEEESLPCEATDGMELVIMQESKKRDLPIKGLETIEFQAGLFDSIPYKEQALELVKSIDSIGTSKEAGDSLIQAYRSQDLNAIERLATSADSEDYKYLDLLLFNRNRNWVNQFDGIAVKEPTLFAVGAGHLVGENGVLELLRKKGYTVSPINNPWTDSSSASLRQ